MRMRNPIALLLAVSITGFGMSVSRAAAPDGLRPGQFESLHALIKPQPGESKWAAIPWLTNLEQARRRAVAEDKPLLLWRAGGGDVLGRA